MVKRKPYQKPEIKQVDLVPEEAVLAGCKTNDGTRTSANSECYKKRFSERKLLGRGELTGYMSRV
jgi:hypothetical protein